MPTEAGAKAARHRVLFLCTGNSCRSQMAEGWTRALHGGRVDAFSAGIEPARLDPRAVRAMAEAGVDISSHRSKGLADLAGRAFDLVVTVCGHARETCPVFPGRTRVLHAGFDDPPRLAEGAGSEEEAMGGYRRVRDEIRAFAASLPEILGRDGAAPPERLDSRYEHLRDFYARLAGSPEGASCACGPGEICCLRAGAADPQASPLFSLIRTGDTVLDMGCGAGRDAFLAAVRVGPEGGVLGVDMCPEMLAAAGRNRQSFEESGGRGAVSFLEAFLEDLPLAEGSVDAALCNGVLSLTLDPERVLAEAARVLRSAGRMVAADLFLRDGAPLPGRNAVPRTPEGLPPPRPLPWYLEAMERAGFFRIRVLEERGPLRPGGLDEPLRSLAASAPEAFRRVTLLARR